MKDIVLIVVVVLAISCVAASGYGLFLWGYKFWGMLYIFFWIIMSYKVLIESRKNRKKQDE